MTAALYIANVATAGPPDDVAVCDSCQEACAEPIDCEHGWTRCRDCGICSACSVEERRP